MQENKDQEPTRLDRLINHPSTQAAIGLIVIVIFMAMAYLAGEREGRHAGLVECGVEVSDIERLRHDLQELSKPPQASPKGDQGAQR